MSRSRERSKPSPKPSAKPTEKLELTSHDWRPIAAIALIALLSCITVLANGFTQDDISILQESNRLHGLSLWKDILTLPYWPPPVSPDLYRPVTSLLLAIQYMVGGGAPSMFRLVSVVLYVLACISMFKLAKQILPAPIALAVAAIFAAHPLHVEAITLAVAQPEILVALLATWMVTYYLTRRRANALRSRDWLFIGIAYLIACFSKEHGIVIPALLVGAEVLIMPHERFRDTLSHWKGFTALAVVGLFALTVRSVILSGYVAASFAADALNGLGMADRALTMLKIVPEWIRLFYWPMHLRAEYSPREFVASTTFGLGEAMGAALLVVAIAMAFYFRKRSRVVAFGLVWIAIALLPVSNVLIPTGILIAERTLFLASVGAMFVAGGLAVALTEQSWYSRYHLARGLAVAVSMLVAIGVWRSAQRQMIWQDAETLTVASLSDSPRSWRVQQAFGEMMFNHGNVEEGKRAFDQATTLSLETWRPRNSFAERLWQAGDDEGALFQLQQSAIEYPGRIETLSRLPAALIATGRYAEAIQLADSIIIAERAPPIMVFYRKIADSALVAKAPAGTVRLFPR